MTFYLIFLMTKEPIVIPDSPASPDPSPPASLGGYLTVSPGYSPALSPTGSPLRPASNHPAPPPPQVAAPQLPSGFVRGPVATQDASTQLGTIPRAATPPLYPHTRVEEDRTQHYSIVPSWGVKLREEEKSEQNE